MSNEPNRTRAVIVKQLTDKIVALQAEQKEYLKHYDKNSHGMQLMNDEMKYLKLKLEQVMNSPCPLLTTH